MLENNAMGSVASSAGFMTGGGNLPAMGACWCTPLRPEPGDGGWLAVIAMLGVFTAVPIKRQLINIEELPFPTGTATAERLHALHGEGSEAARRARKLGWAAAFGAALAFVPGPPGGSRFTCRRRRGSLRPPRALGGAVGR